MKKFWSRSDRGAQWLSGRVLDWRSRGRRFEPHRRHYVLSLSKNINPSFVLVRPRNTNLFISERLFTGRKESNQLNKDETGDILSMTFYLAYVQASRLQKSPLVGKELACNSMMLKQRIEKVPYLC